jgi:hypothetical protein
VEVDQAAGLEFCDLGVGKPDPDPGIAGQTVEPASLNQDDDGFDVELMWSLIDAGGPNWTEHYSDFCGLGESDQKKALLHLEALSVASAKALVEAGNNDQWSQLWSEVIDPYAYLATGTSGRMDLLIRREPGPTGRPRRPLIVDLKVTFRPIPDDDLPGCLRREVTAKYGQMVADRLGKRVDCQILNIADDGYHAISQPKMSDPQIAWPTSWRRPGQRKAS